MAVKITRALQKLLEADGLAADELCKQFATWKATDEYGSYFFGKDSAYTTPLVDGEKYRLRHVHLVPMLDKKQLAAWNRAFRLAKRKTSNRVLIYADDSRGDFLLIFILSEPTAHEIALMKQPTHKALMEGFATVAAAFLLDGSVLA